MTDIEVAREGLQRILDMVCPAGRDGDALAAAQLVASETITKLNIRSRERDGVTEAESLERLKSELQALVDWFNDAPFLRAERLLYDLSRSE